MTAWKSWAVASMLATACTVSTAQPQAAMPANAGNFNLSSTGTLIVIPAFGEVRQANDEVRVVLSVEEQDKDASAAAARVNQKMREGQRLVKEKDPQARLKTLNYYTYPVYPEEPSPRPLNKPRQPTGWRVGQQLEVISTNLQTLPQTVAAAQKVLNLSQMQFGLSSESSRKLEQQRIDAAVRSLTERVVAVAHAMGRNPADAVLETVDFEGSGNYDRPQQASFNKMEMRAASDSAAAEPSFEPGETTLQTQVVGKVRFK